jgi:signal transduction histidine kinase
MPIHWPSTELPHEVKLSAEQAVAIVRIVEEAIANALKHAQPNRIEIGVRTGEPPCQAVLTISDDGPGVFDPDKGRGLNNMRTRAEGAGLQWTLVPADQLDPMKKVQLHIPEPERPHSWRVWLEDWWRMAIDRLGR